MYTTAPASHTHTCACPLPTPTLPPHPPTQAEDLLREALLLQAALEQAVPAAVLERLLPKRFKQYQKVRCPGGVGRQR